MKTFTKIFHDGKHVMYEDVICYIFVNCVTWELVDHNTIIFLKLLVTRVMMLKLVVDPIIEKQCIVITYAFKT
jgi:hypothetical protein